MITCVLKSSFLKRRATRTQHSKHCELVHRLESVLVKNLMQASLDKDLMCDAIATLEEGLVIKWEINGN